MSNLPIAISWQAGAPPPDLEESALREVLAGFLAGLGYAGLGLNLLVTDDETMRALNDRFRGRDQSTDILSWSYRESAGQAEVLVETELLGELAVSLPRVRAQAGENGWDVPTEMVRLLAHGCAHLAGYGHDSKEAEKEMKTVEVALLDEVGLPGLYPED